MGKTLPQMQDNDKPWSKFGQSILSCFEENEFEEQFQWHG